MGCVVLGWLLCQARGLVQGVGSASLLARASIVWQVLPHVLQFECVLWLQWLWQLAEGQQAGQRGADHGAPAPQPCGILPSGLAGQVSCTVACLQSG